jgi:hypothetical protein
MYIDFSLDYDGKCEDISTFEVDGQDLTEDVYFDNVDDFVKKLMNIDEFKVSEHRTEVQVYWNDDKMNVNFRYFNEPEDGEFDDYKLTNLTPIKFEWE